MATAAVPAAVPPEKVEGTREMEEARWQPVLEMNCELTVELSLHGFRVKDFLALAPGSLMPTLWRVTRDVPLRLNGTLIAWCEFEGAGNHLAVRLTELA